MLQHIHKERPQIALWQVFVTLSLPRLCAIVAAPDGLNCCSGYDYRSLCWFLYAAQSIVLALIRLRLRWSVPRTGAISRLVELDCLPSDPWLPDFSGHVHCRCVIAYSGVCAVICCSFRLSCYALVLYEHSIQLKTSRCINLRLEDDERKSTSMRRKTGLLSSKH